MEMFEKAAHYCHSTLKRQLEYNAYHPMEWAINAATLSQFYINKVGLSSWLSNREPLARETEPVEPCKDHLLAPGSFNDIKWVRKIQLNWPENLHFFFLFHESFWVLKYEVLLLSHMLLASKARCYLRPVFKKRHAVLVHLGSCYLKLQIVSCCR